MVHEQMALWVDTWLVVIFMGYLGPADDDGTAGPAQRPPAASTATQDPRGKSEPQREVKRGRKPKWHSMAPAILQLGSAGLSHQTLSAK